MNTSQKTSPQPLKQANQTDKSNQQKAKLTFIGAAQEVTGSCHLLEVNGVKILLDCGMHQGGSASRKINNNEFEFDPHEIDCVVLSHAHLDHSGMLPTLVAQGFNGSIFCTTNTHKLLRVLLEDSYHLYQQDIQRRNKRLRRSKHKLLEMSYDETDVKQALSLCVTSRYCDKRKIAPDVKVTFHDAGHILGSAIVELLIQTGTDSKTLVFSGDLGNSDTTLMPEPSIIEYADIVLLESTYGNRNHRNHIDTLNEFKDIIQQADREFGSILIPAFAVGRTQEVLFQLGCLYQQGLLKGWKVFLDSPMATKITKIYNDSIAALDPKDTDIMKVHNSHTLEEFLPCLEISRTVDDSIQINDIESKVIVVAGSGMCTGGRIKHHFKQRIEKLSTHIIFVGYQATGTFGRNLVEGQKKIRLFNRRHDISAQIHTIGGFSAHAGQDQLIDWVSHIRKPHNQSVPEVYLVHGEQFALACLKEQLMDRLGVDAKIATKNTSIYF